MTDPIPSLRTRLEGPRLLLRAPTDRDAVPLSRVLEQNAAHLRPWSPAPPPGGNPTRPVELTRGIALQRQLWRRGRAFTWLVCAKDERAPSVGEAPIVGRVALTEVVRGVFQNAYVGYWIARDRTGQGLAKEALQLAIDFAFEDAELHRLQAAVMSSNAPSRRVLESCRFRMEGSAARYLKINGTWEDHLIYALTAEERQPAPRARGAAPPSKLRAALPR